MKKYLCWFEIGEPYVPNKIMVETIVESISSCKNMNGVIDE